MPFGSKANLAIMIEEQREAAKDKSFNGTGIDLEKSFAQTGKRRQCISWDSTDSMCETWRHWPDFSYLIRASEEYFLSDNRKTVVYLPKIHIFAAQLRGIFSVAMRIVSWCNGSTTGFGSVCQGSNPCETTRILISCPLSKETAFLFAWSKLFSDHIVKLLYAQKRLFFLLNSETNVQNQHQKPYICFRNKIPLEF